MKRDMLMDLVMTEAAHYKAELIDHLVGECLLAGRDAHFFVAGLMAPVAESKNLALAAEDALALMQAVNVLLPEDPAARVSEKFKADLAEAMVKYNLKKLLDALDKELGEASDLSDAE